METDENGFKTRSLALPAAALLVFLAAGLLFIPLLGFEDDELIFVNLFWHPNECFSRLPLFGSHAIPAMAMSYLGALKSWLYSPLLFFFAPSVWLVRLPTLLAAVFTIVLTGRLLYRIAGSMASGVVICLLATDATFLLTSTFDWGPVVLQHLLFVLSFLFLLRWYREQSSKFLLLGGIAIGLALWDKSLFLWQVTGLAAALVVVGLPIVKQVWNHENVRVFVGGLVLGAFPLVVANLRHHFATIKDNGHLTLAGFAAKAAFLRAAFDGQAATTFFIDSGLDGLDRVHRPFETLALTLAHSLGNAPSQWRFYPGLALIALGIYLTKGTARKWILFFFVSGSIAWLQSACTFNAGNVPHHAVLFWINWYCALALSLAVVLASRLRYVRAGAVLLVALFCVRGVLVMTADYGQLIAHPGTSRWTDADAALTRQLLNRGITHIVEADWGIQNVVRARSNDQIAVDKESPALHAGLVDRKAFDACMTKDCVVVTHAAGRYVSAPANLDQILLQNGLVETGKTVVYDTHGVPGFEFFHLGRTLPYGRGSVRR